MSDVDHDALGTAVREAARSLQTREIAEARSAVATRVSQRRRRRRWVWSARAGVAAVAAGAVAFVSIDRDTAERVSTLTPVDSISSPDDVVEPDVTVPVGPIPDGPADDAVDLDEAEHPRIDAVEVVDPIVAGAIRPPVSQMGAELLAGPLQEIDEPARTTAGLFVLDEEFVQVDVVYPLGSGISTVLEVFSSTDGQQWEASGVRVPVTDSTQTAVAAGDGRLAVLSRIEIDGPPRYEILWTDDLGGSWSRRAFAAPDRLEGMPGAVRSVTTVEQFVVGADGWAIQFRTALILPDVTDIVLEYVDEDGGSWSQSFVGDELVVEIDADLDGEFEDTVRVELADLGFSDEQIRDLRRPIDDVLAAPWGEDPMVWDEPTGGVIGRMMVFDQSLVVQTMTGVSIGDFTRATRAYPAPFGNVALRSVLASDDELFVQLADTDTVGGFFHLDPATGEWSPMDLALPETLVVEHGQSWPAVLTTRPFGPTVTTGGMRLSDGYQLVESFDGFVSFYQLADPETGELIDFDEWDIRLGQDGFDRLRIAPGGDTVVELPDGGEVVFDAFENEQPEVQFVPQETWLVGVMPNGTWVVEDLSDRSLGTFERGQLAAAIGDRAITASSEGWLRIDITPG